jgi:outer membrane protein assembly factor BamB
MIMILTKSHRPARRKSLVLLAAVLAASACAAQTDPAGPTDVSETPSPVAETEVGAVSPRLVLTHDQGLQVLDATTLEEVGSIDLPGFNRVNAAGDGRHVMVSTTGGFQVLDAGTWEVPHGDHSHYYTSAPQLTDVKFAAEKPGHAVVHDGRTVLFDDGTGTVTAQDSSKIAAGADGGRTYKTPSPHHGVAVELEDGTLVVTDGTEDARSTVRALDESDQEIASSNDCAGVHGEAVAGEDAVGFGCEDGVLVYHDGKFTKIKAADAYGATGTQAGSEESAVLLGDYYVDEDAEMERPERIALIDTEKSSMTVVKLPTSYSFRSLGRGPEGEALVLGTDGALHVIDPTNGKITRSVPVVDKWTEPDDWQAPRPTLTVIDENVYITDPANKKLVAVDISTGEVWKTGALSVTPNEIAPVTGEADEHAEHAEGDHDHEHEDEHAATESPSDGQ